MIEFEIAETLREVSPYIKLGCIFYHVTVEKSPPELWKYINSYVKQARLSELTNQELIDKPHIRDSRLFYKALGKDPHRYRISSEALIRRIISGKGLYRVNNIVDINNLISLTTMFSVGSYNLDNLGQKIYFRIGTANDSYKGIGKDFINTENLPVFSDERGAFGSPTSDSERAMITMSSRNIATVVISFSKEPLDLTEPVQHLSKFTDATKINTIVFD